MDENGQKVKRKTKRRKTWVIPGDLNQSDCFLALEEAQILYVSLRCAPMSINSTHHCLSSDASWQHIPLNHILLTK